MADLSGALRERLIAIHAPFHQDGNDWCQACTTCWPCETRRVLDSTPASDGGECPHIVTSDEGTSYCRLAEGGVKVAAELHKAGLALTVATAYEGNPAKPAQASAKPPPNPEAVEGLELYDAVFIRWDTSAEEGWRIWCEDYLRPILAAAADRGAAE